MSRNASISPAASNAPAVCRKAIGPAPNAGRGVGRPHHGGLKHAGQRAWRVLKVARIPGLAANPQQFRRSPVQRDMAVAIRIAAPGRLVTDHKLGIFMKY